MNETTTQPRNTLKNKRKLLEMLARHCSTLKNLNRRPSRRDEDFARECEDMEKRFRKELEQLNGSH